MSSNADLRTRLADADATVADLKWRLYNVEDFRKDIQRQLDQVVYPVLTLPHEITSEIFIQCLPSSTFDDGDTEIRGRPRHGGPSLPATPHLWDHLHLAFNEVPPSVRGRDELEDFVDSWFGRAGSCPLSFTVVDIVKGFGISRLPAALGRYAPRLQSVVLELIREQVYTISDIGPFPLLEKLSLTLRDDDADDDSGLYMDVFCDAPRLKKVHFGEDTLPTWLRLPYEQLSEVTCGAVSGDELKHILCHAPNLLEFTGTLELALELCFFPQQLHAYENQNSPPRGPEFYGSLATHSIACPTKPPPLGCHIQKPQHRSRTIPHRRVWVIATILDGIEICESGHDFLSDFFRMLDRAHDTAFLPNLQSLAFVDIILDSDLDESLLQALSSRTTRINETGALEVFQQFWPKGSFTTLEKSTVSALRVLVEGGTKIHVGPARRSWV
ncbi:hypothetical protein C8R43DRAFT_1229410 [Mycena crocata]|nr:hypothetical protein C8R43DRAFT_1229410 [Mycena crocata]